MPEANHYCANCDTHFRVDIEQHAETYHDGGVFLGVEDGDFRDFEEAYDFDVPEL